MRNASPAGLNLDIETHNIALGSHQYAIQPTWSNEAFDAGKDGRAVPR